LAELKQKVEDAKLLKDLTRDNLSRQEILDGIATIRIMQAQAELLKLSDETQELSEAAHKLSEAERHLSAAEREIARQMRPPADSAPANNKGPITPERRKRIQDLAAEAGRVAEGAATGARQAKEHIKVQRERTTKAMDAAAGASKNAEASAPKGSPEAVACAERQSRLLGLRERMNVEVAYQNERLAQLDKDLKKLERNLSRLKDILKLASLLAPAAAQEVQLAFHKMQQRLLEEADRIRSELASEAEAEAANSSQRKVDAERKELNRESDGVEAAARERRRHLAELNDVAANEKSQQDRERRAAEVAKHQGTTPRAYE
jgi:hypothetical protein